MANAHDLLMAQRAAMMGKSGYTAKDYVQRGLVFMADAIENAGRGKHVQLVRNMGGFKEWITEVSMSMPNFNRASSEDGNAVVTYGSMAVYSSGFQGVVQAFDSGTFTKEVCGGTDSTTSTSGGTYGMGFNVSIYEIAFFCNYYNQFEFRRGGSSIGIRVQRIPASGRFDMSFSWVESGGDASVTRWADTGEAITKSLTGLAPVASVTSFGLAKTSSSVVGDVWLHCYRVYNRALSPNEVAHNRMVDAARFGLT